MGDGQDSQKKHPYNTRTIRAILTKGFSAEELRRFCMDRPLFRPVHDRFTQTMSKDLMVDYLIEFCDQKLIFGELLSKICKENPRLCENFKDQLYVQVDAESDEFSHRKPKRSNLNRFIIIVVIVIVSIIVAVMIVEKDNLPSVLWPNYTLSQTEPFERDMFGIVIADFGKGTDLNGSEEGRIIAEILYRDFATRIQKAGLSSVEVIKLGTVIKNEDEAKNIGTQLRAGIVIWGWVSGDDDIFFPNFTPTARLLELTSKVVEYGELQVYSEPLYQLETIDLGKNLSNRTAVYTTFAKGLIWVQILSVPSSNSLPKIS